MMASRTKGPVAKLFLLLGSVTVSLLAAEALLRHFDLADPPLYDSDPDYGYLMRPNQSASTRGHRFHINNLGLRGADVQVPKPSQTSRIAFLGDSITYGGGGIPDDRLFVNRIVNSLITHGSRPVDSINLSAPGWGIGNITAYAQEYGLHEADAVVWVVPAVDFRRPKTSLERYDFPTTKPWSRFGYALSVVRRNLSSLSGRDRPNCSKGFSSLTQNLGLFADTLRGVIERDGFALAITLPYEQGYGCQLEDRNRFHRIASDIGATILDADPTFEKYSNEKLFTDGVHLNAMGHEVVAKLVAPILWENWLARKVDPSPLP